MSPHISLPRVVHLAHQSRTESRKGQGTHEVAFKHVVSLRRYTLSYSAPPSFATSSSCASPHGHELQPQRSGSHCKPWPARRMYTLHCPARTSTSSNEQCDRRLMQASRVGLLQACTGAACNPALIQIRPIDNLKTCILRRRTRTAATDGWTRCGGTASASARHRHQHQHGIGISTAAASARHRHGIRAS